MAVAVAATVCKQEIGKEVPLQVDNRCGIEDCSIVSEEVADNSRCHVFHINYEMGGFK